MFKKADSVSRHFMVSMIVLCTLAIILSNYIFTKDLAKEVDSYMMQHEYQKIGGEENYLILQELQKRQILEYIATLKAEQPEVIEEILATNTEDKGTSKTVLDIASGDLEKLLADTSVYGGTGVQVTLIEFSDFECSHCISFHEQGVISQLRQQYGEALQYAFKNFPIADYAQLKNRAMYAKCVEKLGGSESYLQMIDALFGRNMLDVTQYGITDTDFQVCMEDGDNMSESIDKEFGQGRYLGVTSTPSVVIIDNTTGEYSVIEGENGAEVYQEVIDGYLGE